MTSQRPPPPPPSPPAEKATACQDQAGQTSTGNGSRHANSVTNSVKRHNVWVSQDASGRNVHPTERDDLVIGHGQGVDSVRG
jgi:hypothetical protein